MRAVTHRAGGTANAATMRSTPRDLAGWMLGEARTAENNVRQMMPSVVVRIMDAVLESAKAETCLMDER